MWKPHLRLAVACLLVLVAQAARAGQPAPARPRPNLSRPQPITAFRPSQVGFGRGLTRYLEQKWERKAQRRGELLTDRLRIKAAHLEVPVVVTPSGELMALDRHHHITALRELAEREGIELALPVWVVKDYRGWSQADFAEHFVNRLKLGYFPPEMRDLSALEKMQLLPRSFDEMRNDPVRSAVGIAFRELDIQRIPMKNYAELTAGDVMVERNVYGRARALGFRAGATSDLTQKPLVRAARELIVDDKKVRRAVKHLGLTKRDRHDIKKKLRKAS